DRRNVEIKNVLFYQDIANSTAIKALSSAVWIHDNTLVSNAPGVTLIHSTPDTLTKNYMFLQDNLSVALPNAAPLPYWWLDNNGYAPGWQLGNGYASENGSGSDWQSTPTGTLMTIADAKFLNTVEQVFRLDAGSAARGQASDGSDQGYYEYKSPVYVDATYCETCDNDGRVWGKTAFNSIQDGIATGAQKVLVDPGLYRERISLVNGVEVFGSGAGLTMLAPPDSNGGFLVGVENAKETTMALMTIAGEDTASGFKVSGDGDVALERLIIRNTTTGITLTGSSALATVINSTLVSNDAGVAATQCASIDIRNSILAFHQNTALGYESSACDGAQTKLHTYNAYWRNGADLAIDGSAIDSPGPGEIFADPRFTDPNDHDYRPLSDSPVVDAGDPSDPAPPGSGLRVDLGYAQAAEASVYASTDYGEQRLNDGLEWQVTAFDTIQDAIDNVPDIEGVWTVGVDGGDLGAMVYEENVNLKSGIRLIGNGAETTFIDGNSTGSVLTLDGVTHVEISGFTITNGGQDLSDAGILVTGASNNITITKNIIGGLSTVSGINGNGNAGVIFQSGSTGELNFNTIATNYYNGVTVQDSGTWVHALFNVIALNDVGFDNSGGGLIFNDYNLVYNTDGSWCGTCQDYIGSVSAGSGEINSDPWFADAANGVLQLTTSSPAVDGIPANKYQPVQTGGGSKADMGYRELLAVPATLLLGKEGDSCGLGSAGVASVDVGIVHVTDASQDVDATLPSSWQPATLSTQGQAGSYWTASVTPDQGDGLYRLYSKPSDEVNNVSSVSSDWFRNEFIADGTAPVVTLNAPGDGATSSAPAISLNMDVSDWVPSGTVGESLYNIASVYFDVDGAVITATQSITVASSGGAQGYERQIALENGSHTITAYAVDQAGNVGQSTPAQVTIVTAQNEAALSSPAPGSAVNSTSVGLQGFVHFQDTLGDGQVEILVDGASAGMAALADTTVQASSWSKTVSLSGQGSHTITMRASRSAGSTGSVDATATLILDTATPSITFSPPTGTITQTVTLSGTASDATSGVASVSVSVDGGYVYQNANLDS
ncbi:MAG: hypothetical protein GY753_15535, partial [Gammaproteobacteria bacterium]|nr:hypothetical protein [Gammaproteobacteria bacterium]